MLKSKNKATKASKRRETTGEYMTRQMAALEAEAREAGLLTPAEPVPAPAGEASEEPAAGGENDMPTDEAQGQQEATDGEGELSGQGPGVEPKGDSATVGDDQAQGPEAEPDKPSVEEVLRAALLRSVRVFSEAIRGNVISYTPKPGDVDFKVTVQVLNTPENLNGLAGIGAQTILLVPVQMDIGEVSGDDLAQASAAKQLELPMGDGAASGEGVKGMKGEKSEGSEGMEGAEPRAPLMLMLDDPICGTRGPCEAGMRSITDAGVAQCKLDTGSCPHKATFVPVCVYPDGAPGEVDNACAHRKTNGPIGPRVCMRHLIADAVGVAEFADQPAWSRCQYDGPRAEEEGGEGCEGEKGVKGENGEKEGEGDGEADD